MTSEKHAVDSADDKSTKATVVSTYQPALWEKLLAYVAAFVALALVAFVVIRNEPFASPNIVVLLRTILSLSVAVLGATIPGFLNITWERGGLLIRAGGALALFLLTFLFTPHVLPMDIEERLDAIDEGVQDIRVNLIAQLDELMADAEDELANDSVPNDERATRARVTLLEETIANLNGLVRTVREEHSRLEDDLRAKLVSAESTGSELKERLNGLTLDPVDGKATVRGKLTDSEGRAVADVRVRVVEQATGVDVSESHAVSDADGRYSIRFAVTDGPIIVDYIPGPELVFLSEKNLSGATGHIINKSFPTAYRGEF